VALVVFALAAVVLGGAYLNILNGYAVISRGVGEDPDVFFARQELLTLADVKLAKAGDEYDTQDGRHVKWTAEIEPTTTADLFSVTFTCALAASGPTDRPRTLTESFMLLRPSWSDPTVRDDLRQKAASRIAKVQGKQP